MNGEDDGAVPSSELREGLEEGDPAGGVKTGRRLVQQEDTRQSASEKE